MKTEVALKITEAAAAVMMMLLLIAAPAIAGPLETARAQEQSFDNAILACNPADADELYENGAMAIYPGAGDIGPGKVAITKLLKNFTAAFCPNDEKKSALKDVKFAASPLGPDYILIIRVIDATDKDGNHAIMRATKVIHQADGKWRYLVDHTSVGLASTPAGGQ
jgi:ketosteroid isomerase-like protein